MGYYDRNESIRMKLAREEYRATQSHTESREDMQNRTNTIERMLIEKRKSGAYLPEPGATIEHRSNKSKGVSRLLDYNLNTRVNWLRYYYHTERREKKLH